MPTIYIPGAGKIAFPDDMSDDDIATAAAQVHAQSNPQSVSRRAQANLDQNAQWDTSAHTNRPLGVNIGRAAVGATADTLPFIGGMAGAVAGGAAGGLPAIAGAGLGGATGTAMAQKLRHTFLPEEANPDMAHDLRDVAKGGIEQGLTTAVPMGVTGLLGKAAGGPEAAQAAEDFIAQAKRSNLDPNQFRYAEAADSPGLNFTQKMIDRSALGGITAGNRAKGLNQAIDAAEAVTKKQVGQPFDDAVEEAFNNGQQVDTTNIVKSASALQDRLVKEGTELSRPAQKLLDRAQSFGLGGGGNNAYPGAYVSYRNNPVPEEPKILSRPATPYEIRGLRTQVSDALMDSNSPPDLRRVASHLEEPTRMADDTFLPPGTRENYRNFKEDFGPDGIRSQVQTPSSGTSFFQYINPATNAAAVGSKALDQVPLTWKVAIAKGLNDGSLGQVLGQILRSVQTEQAVQDRADKVSGDDIQIPRASVKAGM